MTVSEASSTNPENYRPVAPASRDQRRVAVGAHVGDWPLWALIASGPALGSLCNPLCRPWLMGVAVSTRRSSGSVLGYWDSWFLTMASVTALRPWGVRTQAHRAWWLSGTLSVARALRSYLSSVLHSLLYTSAILHCLLCCFLQSLPLAALWNSFTAFLPHHGRQCCFLLLVFSSAHLLTTSSETDKNRPLRTNLLLGTRGSSSWLQKCLEKPDHIAKQGSGIGVTCK
jgi:hypothetical protein